LCDVSTVVASFHSPTGPGCSEAAKSIAGISKHFNTVTVSYSAEALELSNRQEFPLFFRTVPQISQNGYVKASRISIVQLSENLIAYDGQSCFENVLTE